MKSVKIIKFWNSNYCQVALAVDGCYYKRQTTPDMMWDNWKIVPKGTYTPFRDMRLEKEFPESIEVFS